MGGAARLLVAGALVVGLAGCGGGDATLATLAGTRVPTASDGASSAARTAATAQGTTTTTIDTSDVTLGEAGQVTAVPATPRTTVVKPTVPVAAVAPAGFVRAADAEGVVSVAVPDTWTVVPLDDRTLEDLADRGGANFPPETREQLRNAVAQAGQYMKVLAVGEPDAAGRAATLSAIVTPGVLPVSALKAVYPQQVTALGGELLEQADITVDGRPALRVRLRLTMAAGVAESTQLLVPVDGNTVIVSIAGVEPALLERMIAAVVLPRR